MLAKLKFPLDQRTIARGKFDECRSRFCGRYREANRAKAARGRGNARADGVSRMSSNRPKRCSSRPSPANFVTPFGLFVPVFAHKNCSTRSLLNWLPDALLLPEAEFAAVENILPDPEIAAERLALLTRVERERGPHVIVATRASLDQPAPQPGALHSGIIPLKQGRGETMENSVGSLVEAGYERVAQVTTRGQIRCPRRHSRSVFLAGPVAGARGIFW